MKKYIPLILIATFFCVGSVFKIVLMQNSLFMSETDTKANICIQISSMSPIFVGIGIMTAFAPSSFLNWLTSLVNKEQPKVFAIQLFSLRIIGFIGIFSYAYSWYNNCQLWFHNIFR
jgi:hypothetical protein